MLVIIIAISHGYSVAPLMSSRAGPVSHTLGVRPLLTRRGSSSSLCLWGHMKDGIYVSLIYLETLEIFHASKLGTISEQSFTKCLFEVE